MHLLVFRYPVSPRKWREAASKGTARSLSPQCQSSPYQAPYMEALARFAESIPIGLHSALIRHALRLESRPSRQG